MYNYSVLAKYTRSNLDCGSIQATLSVSEEYHTIKFNRTFAKPPMVLVSFARSGYVGSTQIGVRAGSVKTSECVVMTGNKSSTNNIVTIYWIAVSKDMV